MKVAVTGASGHLGSAVIKQLISEIGTNNVIGIARHPEKAAGLGVEIRKGDYNIKADFDKALKGVEVLLLVSGMDAPDVRIVQNRGIISAAKEAGLRKMLFTSFIGDIGESKFDTLLKSYRQTEKDIMESGLQWSIGRDGLYIEPDIDYIEQYKKDGKIANCAGNELSPYTCRNELAFAYSRMILDNKSNSKILNLFGEPITQQQLTKYLNKTFGTDLYYEDMSPEAYLEMEIRANGEIMGNIVAGIYTKIRKGEFKVKSDFREAAGREHISWDEYFSGLKQ